MKITFCKMESILYDECSISNKLKIIRFLYLLRIHVDKGIFSVIDLVEGLKGNTSEKQFILGPVTYDCPMGLEQELKQSYIGTLPSEEVTATLANYDALLLPTFHKGEGYPGIIIEALSVGLPVIATPLKGIKEMIVENESGLFVEAKNSDDLIAKIKSFNTTNFPSFSKKAFEAFSNFDNENVMNRVFKEISNA